MINEMKKKPFKGLNYYEEADKDIFYGRGREAKELADLVELNPLTLVFGKSGIGKTSLLNAGLFPLLRDRNYIPVRIRLDYSSDGLPLLQQVKTEMTRQFDAHHITLIPKSKVESDEEPLIKSFRKVQETLSQKGFLVVEDNESLWQIFRRFDFHLNQGTPSPVPVTSVLVFDQFEEFFTLGKLHPRREELIDELYWLIEDQVPPVLEERILNRQESFSYLREYSTFRVVIGLREDYLPHMDELKQRIPSLHRVLYRVIHLNGIQAREVIDKAGVFTQESIKQDILDQFYPKDFEPGEVTPEKLEVEPALFSLLCDRVYETKVSALTRQAKDEILKDFYRKMLEALPQSEALAQWIEEHLLTEGGFRAPCYLELQSPMSQGIEAAIDKKLLRKVYIGDKEHVEILHDMLASVIFQRKKQRQEEKKQIRTMVITGIISVASVIAIILSVLIFVSKGISDKQYRFTICNRLASKAEILLKKDSSKALRIAEAAYKISSTSTPTQVVRVLFSAAYSSREYSHYCIFLHHDNAVTSAVFSPDGTKVLTASADNTAKVWDLKGNLLAILKGHTARVNSAMFSHDGKCIVTASDDTTAKVWDLEGNLLANLKWHTNPVKIAVFERNGFRIFSISSDNTMIRWDLKDESLYELKGNNLPYSFPYSVKAFSSDGKRIVIIYFDKKIKIWDIWDNLMIELKGHTDTANGVVFSPDEKYILTASQDRTARMWDVKGKLLLILKGHSGSVSSAIFSQDGLKILTASADKTVKLWDLKGNILADLKWHTGEVNSAQFSPDGKYAVTASNDGTAIIWPMPESIMEYLKTAPIPKLTAEEKKELGIDKFNID